MAKHSKSAGRLNRRDLLKGVAAAGLTSGLRPLAKAAEEKQPPVIEGYSDHLSYQAGDSIRFHISTSATKYSVEIARVGAQREIVCTRQDLPGARHPTPKNAATHGCQWPAAFALPVPAEWKSGYYSVLLRGEGRGENPLTGELFFIVRSAHPGRDAKILLQLTTNTYNAYNTWGGSSLYGGKKGQGSRVSFERPYAGFVAGKNFTNLYSGWSNWEYPFVVWAERAGYRLDFAANSDLEFRPEILKPYRLVLSVGHDEYWSSPMRDHLEAFIAAGGNVAFFSGNTCFWQVRSEDGGQALVSYKQFFEKDPVYRGEDHRLLSGMWSHRLIKRPENQLTGVSFAYGGYHRFFEQFVDGAGAYTVHRPDHWMFTGTGLKRGDLLGGKHKVVGYECDGCEFTLKNGLPVPTHRDGAPESFEILGTTPAGLSVRDNSIGWVETALYGEKSKKRHPQPGAAVLGCYTRGGTVVTTGCTEWPNGLRGKDPAVERITRNILDRLS
jgi:hypothetical protein